MDTQQDFSKKIVIVLRKDVASWQLTNTVAHIAAYLGNKMKASFDTGDYFESKDGLLYPRNSQYPIVTLGASEKELKNIVSLMRESDMLWIAYVQEMIDLIDDNELADILKTKDSHEMDILGVGVFGSVDELKTFTKRLSLWK